MAREDPQLKLRLPEGLRDRIKVYAERHGRSMNAEIVRILEREFPEPWSADGRVSELLDMLKILKAGVTDERIDRLAHEIDETVTGIISGRLKGLDQKARSEIKEMWNRHQEELAEYDEYYASLDEEEIENLGNIGKTEKYVDPEFPFDDDKK